MPDKRSTSARTAHDALTLSVVTIGLVHRLQNGITDRCRLLLDRSRQDRHLTSKSIDLNAQHSRLAGAHAEQAIGRAEAEKGRDDQNDADDRCAVSDDRTDAREDRQQDEDQSQGDPDQTIGRSHIDGHGRSS